MNINGAGAPDAGQFRFGAPGWIPLVGDWTGSGHTGIGVFDPATATFYLRNEASASAPDAGRFAFGMPGWLPPVGDCSGSGKDGIGVFDPTAASWYLRNDPTARAADAVFFHETHLAEAAWFQSAPSCSPPPVAIRSSGRSSRSPHGRRCGVACRAASIMASTVGRPSAARWLYRQASAKAASSSSGTGAPTSRLTYVVAKLKRGAWSPGPWRISRFWLGHVDAAPPV